MSKKGKGELHIKLPADLIWEGKERAKQQGISLNKLVNNAIKEHMMRLRLQETKIDVRPGILKELPTYDTGHYEKTKKKEES